MALIKCLRCGHMISDKAEKCPKCGTPVQKVEEAPQPIKEEEKIIPEVESPINETPKADNPINESPKNDKPITEGSKDETVAPAEECSDKPKSQIWKTVCGIIILIAIVTGGIYFYVDSQLKAEEEHEAMLKAKADSAMVADSLARVAAERARQDSIKAVKAIRQKFVRFEDVYCPNPSIYNEYDIDKNLFKKLKERGYSILKIEEDSEYHETFEETIVTKHYYLGVNMEYGGYWKATNSPCSGIECVVSDYPYNSYTIIHFDNVSDLEVFLSDAINFGFKKSGEQEWERCTDNSYLTINKTGDATLKCHSLYPY